jgi:predicted PurR-regulated permease PerM
MLGVVLVANLLIENLVEPAVTGRTLDIHPLLVLLATTVGGVVGGLPGLVMAVPLTVIAMKAVPRIARVLDVDAETLADELATTDDPG